MEPYVGEIRIFAGNFAPLGWLLCQGQLVQISEYDTLFYLVGTTYGGDGQTTFALPNLSSRAVVGIGQGGGLSNYVQGQMAGTENVTLTSQQLPTHSHAITASLNALTQGTGTGSPQDAYFGDQGASLYSPSSDGSKLAGNTVTATLVPAGGSAPHQNTQPSLAINYIIATVGIFPSQQ
jgi:microcystin-dependent protein